MALTSSDLRDIISELPITAPTVSDVREALRLHYRMSEEVALLEDPDTAIKTTFKLCANRFQAEVILNLVSVITKQLKRVKDKDYGSPDPIWMDNVEDERAWDNYDQRADWSALTSGSHR